MPSVTLGSAHASLRAVYKVGQRVVDNIEFVDFGGEQLLYAAQSVVAGKFVGVVDSVFQLLS